MNELAANKSLEPMLAIKARFVWFSGGAAQLNRWALAMKRLFLWSLIGAAAVVLPFIALALLGLYELRSNPANELDDAPQRAAGAILYFSPFLFIALFIVLFFRRCSHQMVSQQARSKNVKNRKPNKPLVPTRKSDALLLAAQRQRWAFET